MATAAVARRAEIKTRTTDEVKRGATEMHARFDFSEGRGYKYRPVVMLATQPDGSLVAMVTGAGSKISLEHDYLIREWKAAGLDKPSIARLDRIAEITR